MMKPATCLLVLLLFAYSSAHGATAQEVRYNNEPGNIQGSVLVLDVTSLRFQRDAPPGNPPEPLFRWYDRCEQACKNLATCNAWVYCSKPEGCSSGCKTYTEQNPQLAPNSSDPRKPNSTWHFPYQSAGPFGPTAACVVGPGASEADSWPWGTCTLKRLDDPANPTYWSKDATEGWISGTIVVPPACKDISGGMCEACATVKDPVRCRACARGPMMIQRRGMGLAEESSLLPGRDMPESGCLTCWNSSAAPDRCTRCLSDLDQPCSKCPVDMFETPERVDACITCSSRFGESEGMYGACIACAKYSDGEAFNKCMACLSQVRKVACPVGVRSWEVNDTCRDMIFGVGLDCEECATRAADYGACTTCMATPPLSWDCGYCGTLPSKEDQASCYKCRRDSGMGGAVCGDLYTQPPSATRDRLLACMTDPTITAGRGYCASCISYWYAGKDPDGTLAAKCVECLRSNPSTGFEETCPYLS